VEVPIVVTEIYDVRPGYETDFYSWGTALLQAMARSDSYLGGDIRDPEFVDGEWQIVHRWAYREDVREWEASDSRQRWLTAAAAFARPHSSRIRAARAPAPERFTPDEPAPGPAREPAPAGSREPAAPAPPSPPPKWKMAVVTLMAVFPPVLFFNLTLIPKLQNISVVPRTLMLCLGVTPIVTWIMMPRLQRLMKGWLTGTRRPARTGAAWAGSLPAEQPSGPEAEPAGSFPRFRAATVPTGVRDGRAGAPPARSTDLAPADPYLRRSR
jgi:uncharacterized protein